MTKAFITALEAYKRRNSLNNALALARTFGRDERVMQELSEPDAGLVQQACKLFDQEWLRRKAKIDRLFAEF